MKKGVLTLSLLLVAIFIIFRFCNTKPDKVMQEKSVPLSISENSGSFNESFSQLLQSYFSLKDAFIESDTVKVNAAAGELMQYADSLHVNEIKGDSSGTITETAKIFSATISSSAQALAAEKGIEEKRKEFETLSDALWSLTRTVRFDKQTVYYVYCPMALDNKGAYWLSDKKEIRNPYFGNKMLNCGEIADSVHYSKR